MKLDVRGLPCGTLVNRHGSTSSRSNQTGLFYCGMKVMVGVQGCDGYCGPTNGPNCQACKILQSQATTFLPWAAELLRPASQQRAGPKEEAEGVEAPAPRPGAPSWPTWSKAQPR